jgi:hypothetical protein
MFHAVRLTTEIESCCGGITTRHEIGTRLNIYNKWLDHYYSHLKDLWCLFNNEVHNKGLVVIADFPTFCEYIFNNSEKCLKITTNN